MITRLEIKNFRCFETLSLSGFKRFNLIVGESGSGKTALLETLFLIASGNPESFFRLRKWRGFGDGGPAQLNGTRDSYEGLFRYIFHDRESNRKMATIVSTDNNLGRRTLEMYFGDKETLDLSLKSPENSMSIKPIHFKYDIGNIITNIALEIKDGAMRGVGSADIYPLHFISGKNVNSSYDASLFSSISRKSQGQELLDAVRAVFDSVEDLSLEIDGGETLIHAKMRGIKDKMPLTNCRAG